MSDSPVTIVTGASRGIGAATALEFGRAGYRVALIARNEQQLIEVGRQVAAYGTEAIPLAGDLADLAFAESCIAKIVERWGRIDVLVNNAGVMTPPAGSKDKLVR